MCERAGVRKAGEDSTERDKDGCSHGSTKHHSLFHLFSEEWSFKQIQNLKLGGNWTKPFLPSSGTPVWEEGIFKGSFCPGEFLDRPLEPQMRGSVKLRNVSLWVCSQAAGAGGGGWCPQRGQKDPITMQHPQWPIPGPLGGECAPETIPEECL